MFKTTSAQIEGVGEIEYSLYDDEKIFDVATNVVASMSIIPLTVSTAESCTGGWIAKAITDIAGSSSVLEGSIVSYSNQSKQKLLGVDSDTLEQYGAVSDSVVDEMAAGVKASLDSDFAIAVSGIAGPGGAVPGKPVGTVWIAWNDGQSYTHCFHFEGDREAVRRQTIMAALKGLLLLVSKRTQKKD